MACLIIDNYDSYTHILANLIWKISGEEPLVFKNDEKTLEELEGYNWDRIVISPGPGRVDNPEYFGVCKELILKYTNLPLLGVCLGHQGLGYLAGAKLKYLDTVCHGKISPIEHYGDSLFKGLPKHFSGTRYHSMVLDMDSILESGEDPFESESRIKILAKSQDDGQIMAIKLSNINHYGVQFHPESVGTSFGEIILSNFLNINRKTFNLNSLHKSKSNKTDVHSPNWEQLPWKEPAEVAQQFFSSSDDFFWLDSADEHSNSNWSFMGRAERSFIEKENSLHQLVNGVATHNLGQNALEFLKQQAINKKESNPNFPIPFDGGYVFAFPYNWNHKSFGLEQNFRVTPWIMEVNEFLAFQHIEKKLYWVKQVGQAHSKIFEPENNWRKWFEKESDTKKNTLPTDYTFDSQNIWEIWKASLSKEEYLGRIAKAQEKLKMGESYEICLSNLWSAEADLNSFDLYLELRRHNPAPFMAFMKMNRESILSSSPERFLKVFPDGEVLTEPIKGTRKKTGLPEQYENQKLELLESKKEDSELLMITDLLRNDLAKECRPGSVHLKSLKKISQYASVFQLSSEIAGRLREGRNGIDLINSCFPGGSICGAPKKRTLEIIEQLEPQDRGFYTGSLGYLGKDGAMDSNILIRSFYHKETHWEFGAGGAVLAVSDPEKEWDEVLAKAEPLIKAFSLAQERSQKNDLAQKKLKIA